MDTVTSIIVSRTMPKDRKSAMLPSRHATCTMLRAPRLWLNVRACAVLLQGRPAAWGKVDALREAMEDDRWDWVAWIDCDLYFMDMNRTLDSLLLTHARAAGEASPSIDASVHMLVTEDAQSINTAILLMRRSAWSRRLLARDPEQNVIIPFFAAFHSGSLEIRCSRGRRSLSCLGMGR